MFGNGTGINAADFGSGSVDPVFAISPLRGARAFYLNSEGWLRGITYPYLWTPGINTARCLKSNLEPSELPDHSLWECVHGMGHGFYGYFDGSNSYRSLGRPEAIIEGYGTGIHAPVIGSRGFRAGLAEIVALTFPSIYRDARKEYELALERYAGIPIFDTFEDMIEEYPLDNGQTYRR